MKVEKLFQKIAKCYANKTTELNLENKNYMLDFTSEEFEKLKQTVETLYKSIIDGVSCPYFGEKISFNAKGLEHLKFLRKIKIKI